MICSSTITNNFVKQHPQVGAWLTAKFPLTCGRVKLSTTVAQLSTTVAHKSWPGISVVLKLHSMAYIMTMDSSSAHLQHGASLAGRLSITGLYSMTGTPSCLGISSRWPWGFAADSVQTRAEAQPWSLLLL
jgi:hypothetical protein